MLFPSSRALIKLLRERRAIDTRPRKRTRAHARLRAHSYTCRRAETGASACDVVGGPSGTVARYPILRPHTLCPPPRVLADCRLGPSDACRRPVVAGPAPRRRLQVVVAAAPCLASFHRRCRRCRRRRRRVHRHVTAEPPAVAQSGHCRRRSRRSRNHHALSTTACAGRLPAHARSHMNTHRRSGSWVRACTPGRYPAR